MGSDENLDEAIGGLEPPSSPRGFDRADREPLLVAVRALDRGWRVPHGPIALTPKPWLPDLEHGDGSLCHLHLIADLGVSSIVRLRGAREAGRGVYVAAPEEEWRSERTLLTVDELWAKPVILDSDSAGVWSATAYASVAELVAMRGFVLSPECLQQMGRSLLDRALTAGTSNDRGWIFEHFLCLLFSQVVGFRVFAHNSENETEEIDLVVINQRLGGWALPPAPLVLVSAKNQAKPVGKPALESLHGKMVNRRGMSRLAFLCASGAIAESVRTHELRYSQGDKVIVLLDGAELKRLLDSAADLTREIETLVVKASLA